MKNRNGQIMVGVIALLVVLAILIPAMVKYVQNESKWSMKETQNTNAFQLAEAAVDRAYQKIVESTSTWTALKNGQTQAGYRFDTGYSDILSGTYAISITSGPLTQQVTITAIGRDKQNKETRALKVVYGNAVLSDISIAAAKGIAMSGNNIDVEWGAVSSPKEVNMYSKKYPSYWSAAGIKNGASYVDTNGASPPNCDSPKCWWWHSYYTKLPPMPVLDFEAYKSSAIAAGNDACGNAYYKNGSYDKNNFTDKVGPNYCNSTGGQTYYVTGNWSDFKQAVAGNIIVRGNLTFSNGNQRTIASYNATIPPAAWKQYCGSDGTPWTHYTTDYDPALAATPVCFGNINNSYRASGITKGISPAIHGFMYVGGDLTLPNGGGSSDLLHGSIVVDGNANISSNSNCKIYYDPDVASNVMTTNVVLIRQSWQDTTTVWPAALP
ncbi:MAG TPA: hypothetical protein DCZ92_02770 [Elusimicrobia bacterium]|nr:MAG: hypothetical protein A2016_09210 [Elusimicrobia bacterium GWF2_62_30]HBA59747.1 hypothetical protein [Elusimicrobiota bacterium]